MEVRWITYRSDSGIVGMERGRMWKKTIISGRALNLRTNCAKTSGTLNRREMLVDINVVNSFCVRVHTMSPTLSKNMPTPLTFDTTPPPNAAVNLGSPFEPEVSRWEGWNRSSPSDAH